MRWWVEGCATATVGNSTTNCGAISGSAAAATAAMLGGAPAPMLVLFVLLLLLGFRAPADVVSPPEFFQKLLLFHIYSVFEVVRLYRDCILRNFSFCQETFRIFGFQLFDQCVEMIIHLPVFAATLVVMGFVGIWTCSQTNIKAVRILAWIFCLGLFRWTGYIHLRLAFFRVCLSQFFLQQID
eukprot:COSAG02_NODE_4583_length_5190_cov_4.804753_6_plen_183_part_00